MYYNSIGGCVIKNNISVFVYGTIKSGHRNSCLCNGADSVVPAEVRGQLYDLPYGFPAVVFPDDHVYGLGTRNFIVDAKKQQELIEKHKRGVDLLSAGDYGAVYGELVTFTDPMSHMYYFDELEGYTYNRNSMYYRVLVPVKTDRGITFAWSYDGRAIANNGERNYSGVWGSREVF